MVRRFVEKLFRSLGRCLHRANVFCFGLVALLVCSGLTFCSGQDRSNQLTVHRIAGVFIKPVPGAPFSGMVEIVTREKLPDGSVSILKSTNYIARDSLGRTHNEARRMVADAYQEKPPLTDIQLFDPATNLSTHLDPFTFIAKQTALRAPPAPSANSVPAPNPNDLASPVKQVDDLGTRVSQNLTLHGTRQSHDATDFDEYWYSPDLSIFMSHRHKDPVWEQTVDIVELNRNEPDPVNFTVPANYKIVAVAERVPVPDASGAYHVGNGVLPPKIIYAADPQFSPQARKAKYGGVAKVSLIVDAQGNPQNVQIIQHLKMGLDEETLAAIKKYRFKPATLEGKPVPVVVNLEVNFRIY